jgi:photosystem II stability/assembly factor-like uncharacterized protein
LHYIGLKQTVTTPPNDAIYSQFRPKCRVIDSYVYVCTNTGIYRKDLTVTADTIWEPFALKDIPVTEFVKNGDKLLAILPKSRDSLLLLSSDNGRSFINYTSPHFFASERYNYPYRIAQNKQNPHSILILHANYGISKSEDFGRTWKNLNSFIGGYQDRFVAFHPADSLMICYSGETEFFSSYVQTSFDGGLTWINSELEDNNCTHSIAFHPVNPDILVSAGEGRMTQSTDRGRTWHPAIFPDRYLYFHSIIFDEKNPDTVYASGSSIKNNDTIYVYRSIDAGDSWQLYYMENMGKDCGGVPDMAKYQDKLILYTRCEGIYELDLNHTTAIPASGKISGGITVYPNPAGDFVYFTNEAGFDFVEIRDVSGRLVTKSRLSKGNHKMDVSAWSAGIYLANFHSRNNKITKNIIIK